MRHLLFVVSCAVAGAVCGVEPLLVKNVSAAVERGTHLVRISYDLSNEADEPAYVTLDAQTNGISIGWDKFRTLDGDVTKLADPKPVACGTELIVARRTQPPPPGGCTLSRVVVAGGVCTVIDRIRCW